MLLSLSARATTGKDLFTSLLIKHLGEKNAVRVAFADFLKAELDPLFKAFGGTAFETDPIKKERQRPVIVSHGMTMRTLDPMYWVKRVETQVKESLAANKVVIIPDARFENEIDWVHSLGGKSLYLNREGIPFPNEEERQNDGILRTKADFIIEWPTLIKKGKIDVDRLNKIVEDSWKLISE